MKLLNYARYSGVFVTIVLNPLHWRLGFASGRDEIMGPNSWFCKITLLAVGVNVVVDNGDW